MQRPPDGTLVLVTEAHLRATLMPWLHLRSRIDFAGYAFAHLTEIAPALPPDTASSLAAIGGTFTERDGRPIDPVVAWPSDEGVPTFAPSDVSIVADRARLLFLGALCATDYFTLANPVNATHFDVVGQNFTPSSEYVSFWARRRDGEVMMGGTRFGEVRVSRPVAAYPAECPIPNPQLLDALALALSSDDPALRRVITSSDALRRGNRLELADSIDEDLFWCVTALEQLLVEARMGKARQLADEIACRVGKRVRWGYRQILWAWAKEAYDTRSEVHGKPARSTRWSKWVHALLATEAYTLVVLGMLDRHPDVSYALTDADRQRLEAFPRQVAAVTQRRIDASEHGATPLWHGARDKAKRAVLHQQVIDHLRRLEDEERQ
jgi:hypothetical protein